MRGETEGTLTWRLRESDPRVTIPRSQWRLEKQWAEAEGRRGPLPLVSLEVAGGLQPGYLYELVYEAHGSLVQGLGLAGIRDLVSFLKHETTDRNPLSVPDEKDAAKRRSTCAVRVWIWRVAERPVPADVSLRRL